MHRRRWKVHTKFWSEKLKGRGNLGELRVHEIITKKQDVRMWTGFIWLRIGTSGGLL
jgi:hypothetical protein